MHVARRTFLRSLLLLPLAGRWAHGQPQRLSAGEWTSLFNGRNLTGWETFLGKPHASTDLPGPRDAKGEHVNRVGVDTDPDAQKKLVERL